MFIRLRVQQFGSSDAHVMDVRKDQIAYIVSHPGTGLVVHFMLVCGYSLTLAENLTAKEMLSMIDA